MAFVKKGTRYYSEEMNRLGKPVYYYRRPGFPKIRLNALPNTAAMDREFHAAAKATDQRAEDKAAGRPEQPGRPMVACKPSANPDYVRRFGDSAEPGAEGTLRWAVDRFEAGEHLQSLEPWTRRAHLRNLRHACGFRTVDGRDAYGEFMLDTIEQEHVQRLHRSLRTEPARADSLVKSLRLMFNWLKRSKLHRGDNPASGLQWFWDKNGEGHETAEIADIEKLERAYPVGTPQRATLALMFYAGVRVSDAHQLGPFNLKRGGTELHWIEYKGSHSTAISNDRPTPKTRELEVHAELLRVLKATPVECGRFAYYMEAGRQRPYSRSGVLSNAVRRWCKAAGVSQGISAHSIRKASAARMYEAGASEAELCSIFGWEIGSGMAAHYARKYSKRRAQQTGLARLPVLRSSTEAA